MGELSGLLTGDRSATGLLGLVVVLILFGGLVPRWSFRERLTAERERADEWKKTAEAKDETIRLLSEHLAETIEHSRTTTAIVRSIPHPARDGGGQG